MRKTICKGCGSIVDRSTAPFPVVTHPNTKLGVHAAWYCNQECMSYMWPDAGPPLAPGNIICCDYAAYECPRLVLEHELKHGQFAAMDLPEADGGGFTYVMEDPDLGDHQMPWGQWAILVRHPERDSVLVVPATGDRNDYERALAGDTQEYTAHLPLAVQARYVAWLHKGDGVVGEWYLFLGSARWLRRKDIPLHARQWQIDADSIKSASRKWLDMLSGCTPK
jgi:hypothetical protein